MSDDLLARKGRAAPAASHPGGESRFHGRRTIVLPPIGISGAATDGATSPGDGTRRPARAARLTGPGAQDKRKFTFRIDLARHKAFCEVAEQRSISRQKLLTEALDALLLRLGHPVGTPGTPGEAAAPIPAAGATMLPDNVAALPPPL